MMPHKETLNLVKVLHQIGFPASDHITEALLKFQGLDPTMTAPALLDRAREAKGRVDDNYARMLTATLSDRIQVMVALAATRDIAFPNLVTQLRELRQTPAIDVDSLSKILADILPTADFVEHLAHHQSTTSFTPPPETT